jgi:hypothetical protein
MLDPSVYVQRIKSIAGVTQKRLSIEALERVALERLPNYKHSDGRIYASHKNQPYFAVSVSPLNPNFDQQIEPGILPVVNSLLIKNYLPVSSCEGHHDSPSFVRIVFGSEQAADNFIQEFGVMDYVVLTKLYRSSNTVQSWDRGEFHYRFRFDTDTVDKNLEIQDINFLFRRNYQDICYVDIVLYQMTHSVWNFYKTYKIVNDMKQNKHKRINNIAQKILSMKDYEL